MAFKLNLSKFKKISTDGKTTTLKHDDGHEIKIAHKPLSKGHRKQLEEMELCDGGMMAKGGSVPSRSLWDPGMDNSYMADGGSVPHPTSSPKAKSKDDNNYQVGEEGSIGNKITKAVQSLAPFNKGGKVSKLDKEMFSIHNNPKLEQSRVRLADGGETGNESELNQLLTDAGSQPQPQMADQSQPVPLPPGTPIDQTQAADENQSFFNGLKSAASGVGNAINTGFEGLKQGLNGQPVQDNSQMSTPGGQPSSKVNQSTNISPEVQKNETPKKDETKADNGPSIPGLDKEVAGINAQAKAVEDQAKRDQATLTSAGMAADKLKTSFDMEHSKLENERQSLISDINNGHIDPNHFYGTQNTGQKIATGISILLGGLFSRGGPNAGLEYLNRQVDQDIAAQKDNLQSKESLLSANLRQFGNLQDATNMTKVMMNDQLINKLQQSAAKAKGPMAQAMAMQSIGQLQAQNAPLMQQMAIKQALNNASTSQPGKLIKQDPANFVPQLVPKEHQKDVFKEIKQATDTAKITPEIIKAFDKASQFDPSKMLPHSESAAQKAFLGLINTTVQELTGTARAAEFRSIESNFKPQFGDKPSTIESKRNALLNYLQAKSAAPTAKAYGIDLSKFEKTNQDPTAQIYNTLSPQQQAMVEWAQKNPQNHEADMVLKKLKLK